MSKFPVLSPFPNNVPSILSAPANNPNSAAAVDVPLSLCGCKLIVTQSLFLIFLLNHSIWSAYLFGVVISTVDGKFIIILFSCVGSQTSITASQISRAYSISVPVKLSGEYSNWKFVSGYLAASSFINFAPLTAIPIISSFSILNTTSLCNTDVELYKCTIAFLHPLNASKVFVIKCSLD